MAKKFDLKTVQCDSADVYTRIDALETEWLKAILSRAGVSKVMMNKAISDDNYSAEDWRDYLFNERGLTVIKDITENSVAVYQINFDTGRKLKIGEWSKPTITRIKKSGVTTCELGLKYWQVI